MLAAPKQITVTSTIQIDFGLNFRVSAPFSGTTKNVCLAIRLRRGSCRFVSGTDNDFDSLRFTKRSYAIGDHNLAFFKIRHLSKTGPTSTNQTARFHLIDQRIHKKA